MERSNGSWVKNPRAQSFEKNESPCVTRSLPFLFLWVVTSEKQKLILKKGESFLLNKLSCYFRKCCYLILLPTVTCTRHCRKGDTIKLDLVALWGLYNHFMLWRRIYVPFVLLTAFILFSKPVYQHFWVKYWIALKLLALEQWGEGLSTHEVIPVPE